MAAANPGGSPGLQLEGQSKLSDEERKHVQDLAYAWDLPPLTENNRRWLFEKLLLHSVIGRVTRPIKQLRRGLKETPMWTLLTQRPDTVPLLFPQQFAAVNPEVLLQRIVWPEDEDDDCPLQTKCRITGYMRHFILNATPSELTNLLKFWTGWEMVPKSLTVELVDGRHPPAMRPCAFHTTTRTIFLLRETSLPALKPATQGLDSFK